MRNIVFALLAATVWWAAPVAAHHSTSNFDLEQNVTIKGVIKQVSFRNPHSTMVLSVPNDDGSSTDWNIEFSSVNLLVRRGWQTDRIKVGDTVECTGNPFRRDPTALYMWTIKLPDGTVFAK